MKEGAMRLVTRGDMDGLTSAVIISLNEEISDVELIHPQDITSGRAEIRTDDILINVPYHPNCGMWFDHHQHTATYREPPADFKGAYGLAPSAARLVFDYYGGAEKMPELAELVHETDRMDSADLKIDDVTRPSGYIKLGFTIDSRTGIGAFKDYFLTLYDLLRRLMPVEEILAHPAVARRCQRMDESELAFRTALREHSRVEGNVIVTDFRGLSEPPVGNRFLVYALYPDVNVSIRLHWGPKREFVVAVVGHSIFNRSCTTDVGELAARYGGGGHRGAGSIPLDPDTADDTVAEIVAELQD
jgi:hypothetical protein